MSICSIPSTSHDDTSHESDAGMFPSTPSSASRSSRHDSQSADRPIPSIEPPDRSLYDVVRSTPGNDTPRSSSIEGFQYSFGNIKITDPPKEARLSLPGSSSSPFQFGNTKEISPFTFRKLHNATPEPSSRRDDQFKKDYSTHEVSNTSDQGSPARNNEATEIAITNQKPLHQLNIEKYDVRDEKPPDEPYFDPNFQQALKTGKSIASQIEDTLRACELSQDRDSHIYSLLKIAEELHHFDAPSVCCIGIVGDSGVGKSSLINSLLDEPDLARTAGLGTACTSVVTEYRLRKHYHNSKYTIEIDRMTEDEISEQLKELLWSYRQFFVLDLNESHVTADEQNQLEEQSKLAWDTLKAAFGEHDILTERFLRDESTGAEERIRTTLATWTSQLSWPAETERDGWLGSAETCTECNRKTQQFLTGNLWPFIKVIRIYLSSQILKSGAVLADLPGFHDSNNARVKAAEKYMYDCDEIFIVADISRVITNKNVESVFNKSLVKNLKSSKPSQGISLVCTKSEDLDIDEVKHKFFSSGNDSMSITIEHLEQEIEDAEADDGRAGALRRRDKAQDELDYIFMTARNKYISDLAKQTHASRFGNRQLSVFCVSNKAYKRHRNRVKKHDLPMKGSGIPGLRNHCHKIPARAQYRVADHYLTVRLKDLLQRVQLWLTGGSELSLLNDQTIQRLLGKLNDNLQKKIATHVTSTKDAQILAAKTMISQPMKQSMPGWTAAAQSRVGNWQSLHHTQFAAFCRNYGSWGSVKVAYAEWNLEIIETMVGDMQNWWEALVDACNERLDVSNDFVLSELDSLTSQVKEFHGAPLFAEALVTKIMEIEYIFSQIGEDFSMKAASIKRDTTGNHRGSYIYEEMSNAYRSCAQDSGPGVTQRRISLLREAIGSPSNPILFTNIRNRLSKDLRILFIDCSVDLHIQIATVLQQIGRNLEMLRGSEAKVLAKNGNYLERLSKVVDRVLLDMDQVKQITELVKVQAKSDGYI